MSEALQVRGPARPRRCSACGATVLDLVNDKTGRRAAIDARKQPLGNITADLLAGTYHVYTKVELAQVRAFGVVALYVNHYANCPQAGAFHARAKAR